MGNVIRAYIKKKAIFIISSLDIFRLLKWKLAFSILDYQKARKANGYG